MTTLLFGNKFTY